jgi:hypothetical protein
MRTGPSGKGLSRRAIVTEVDHSLRRLGTDYIDLYQVHRNDHATPLETLEALSDLVKSGKVRYLGASSMPAWEVAKALHLQRQHGWARFVSMQDHYNPPAWPFGERRPLPSGTRDRPGEGRSRAARRQRRAWNTRLNGVSATRVKSGRPAAAATSRRRASPAWAPRAAPTSCDNEFGVHNSVDAP